MQRLREAGVAFTLSFRLLALSLPMLEGLHSFCHRQRLRKDCSFDEVLPCHAPMGAARRIQPAAGCMVYHPPPPASPPGATKGTTHEKRKEAHGRHPTVPHRVRPCGRRIREADREGDRRQPVHRLTRDQEAHLRELQGILRQGEPVRPPRRPQAHRRLRGLPRQGRSLRPVQLPQLQQVLRPDQVHRLPAASSRRSSCSRRTRSRPSRPNCG